MAWRKSFIAPRSELMSLVKRAVSAPGDWRLKKARSEPMMRRNRRFCSVAIMLWPI